MKKLIILKHGGGELANQLWNYISIYVYGLEIKAEVKNPSFFEYHSYFNFIKNESTITKIFSFWFKKVIGRRGSARNKFWRFVYKIYSTLLTLLNRQSVISSENTESKVTYLPPTTNIALPQKETLYFTGWLFRNPAGLKKFRNELVSAFAPHESIKERITEIITPLQNEGKKIIGVHIRQSDYKEFKNGAFLVDQGRIRRIIDEYLSFMKLNPDQFVFVITSDGPVDQEIFKGLHIYISRENSVTDLFLLSKMSVIIGSNSSFGAFASWYGNIPHIIATKEPIDWQYYSDKKTFFENKYCTMVKY